MPKTGSTSLMNVAYKLHSTNNFNVLHVNASRFATRLSSDEQARFVHNVTTWSKRLPGVYHGHFSFIDFDSFLTTIPAEFAARTMLYINVVRDPLARLVSYYYFMRFGDDFRPHVVRGRQSNAPVMFDDCVKQRGNDCDPERMWLQVPYFCGQFKFCMQPPGNQLALKRAKQNLLHKYFLVGITEELPSFVRALETALPSIFRGAGQILNRTDSWKRRTRFKQTPYNSTFEVFRSYSIYQAEKEFYDFAKNLFHAAQQRIANDNFAIQNGWLANDVNFVRSLNDESLWTTGTLPDAQSSFFRTKGTQFFYEKIKPP